MAHRATGGPSSEAWASPERRGVISRSSTMTTSTRPVPATSSRGRSLRDRDEFTSSGCGARDHVYGGYGCVYDGGIGTPMFVIPNDGSTGTWTKRRQGDFDFITSTLARHRRRPRFHEEVIAEIRPHEACRSLEFHSFETRMSSSSRRFETSRRFCDVIHVVDHALETARTGILRETLGRSSTTSTSCASTDSGSCAPPPRAVRRDGRPGFSASTETSSTTPSALGSPSHRPRAPALTTMSSGSRPMSSTATSSATVQRIRLAGAAGATGHQAVQLRCRSTSWTGAARDRLHGGPTSVPGPATLGVDDVYLCRVDELGVGSSSAAPCLLPRDAPAAMDADPTQGRPKLGETASVTEAASSALPATAAASDAILVPRLKELPARRPVVEAEWYAARSNASRSTRSPFFSADVSRVHRACTARGRDVRVARRPRRRPSRALRAARSTRSR